MADYEEVLRVLIVDGIWWTRRQAKGPMVTAIPAHAGNEGVMGLGRDDEKAVFAPRLCNGRLWLPCVARKRALLIMLSWKFAGIQVLEEPRGKNAGGSVTR